MEEKMQKRGRRGVVFGQKRVPLDKVLSLRNTQINLVFHSFNRTFAQNSKIMIYPNTFEEKIGFTEIRSLLRERCLSPLGKEKVDEVSFSSNAETINEWLLQVKEFRRLQEEADDFPMQYFFDVRASVARLRLEGTHMEEAELFDLRRSLDTIDGMVRFLNRESQEEAQHPSPITQHLPLPCPPPAGRRGGHVSEPHP